MTPALDLGGLAEPISASVETGALDNECRQGGRVDGVTVVEIDGTNRLAVQTRVEEPFRILQLGPFWKRQPHGVLEGLAYADDAVVGPDGDSFGAGGLLPLHLFDYAGVGTPDQSPQLAQLLTPPAGGLPDDGIDLLGRGCVIHADGLPRRLSIQRTEGLSSLSFRCVQPSQQHGRRFPSSSSDRNRSMCWLLVSAFFGQSTQQIHSLRARGVRSSHTARAFGVAIKTRLSPSGRYGPLRRRPPWNSSIAHPSSDSHKGTLGSAQRRALASSAGSSAMMPAAACGFGRARGQSMRWARATMIPSGPRT